MVAEKMAARVEEHINVSDPPFQFERRVRERPITVRGPMGDHTCGRKYGR